MAKYIFKRLLYSLLTLFIMSLIIFSLIHLIPGDPAAIILGPDATSQMIEKLQAQMGFDRPLVIQYLDWIGSALQGDFGVSFYNNTPVAPEIFARLKISFTIAVFSQVLAILIAIPMGVISAKNKGGKSDNSITVFSLAGVSIPNFLLSMLLVLLFGITLRWLPTTGYGSLSDGLWGYLKYIILPVVSLGVPQAALLTRMTKSMMSDIINMDFIRTETAKGMSERIILYKHALRNALVPILTIVAQTFGGMIASSAIVETLFNIKGLGYLVINSIQKRDYPQLQAVILVVSALYILINLIVDLLYGIIDPRIKLGKKMDQV